MTDVPFLLVPLHRNARARPSSPSLLIHRARMFTRVVPREAAREEVRRVGVS